MTEFGYTLMCEQSPPDALVSDAVELMERYRDSADAPEEMELF